MARSLETRKGIYIPAKLVLGILIMSLLSQGIRTLRREGLDRVLLLAVRYMSYRTGYHDRVSQLPRPLAEGLFSATAAWVRLSTRFLHRFRPYKYTDADPYRLLYVDPARIECVSGLHDKRRRGWVIDGNWDQDCKRFLDLPIPRSIYDHYEHDVPWQETQLADLYQGAKFDRKCETIARLHGRIRRDGFESQRRLVERAPEAAWRNCNTTIAPYTDEITVDIARDGEILWNMLGRHRLAIAKVLGLSQIPVLVFARHRQWQEFRSNHGMGNKTTMLDKEGKHPDLKCKSRT